MRLADKFREEVLRPFKPLQVELTKEEIKALTDFLHEVLVVKRRRIAKLVFDFDDNKMPSLNTFVESIICRGFTKILLCSRERYEQIKFFLEQEGFNIDIATSSKTATIKVSLGI